MVNGRPCGLDSSKAPEREQRWQTALAWFPAWARYEAITERELRLFELQPITDPPGRSEVPPD